MFENNAVSSLALLTEHCVGKASAANSSINNWLTQLNKKIVKQKNCKQLFVYP